MKLGGIIYLHDISQARMLGTTRKNFDMFRKLCGEQAERNVILGTTKWSEVLPEVGKRREDELKGHYWNQMIASGSRVQRFQGTHESARKIVNMILDSVETTEHLQIQRELVELSRYIPETEAGKTLRYTLQQLLEMQRKMAEELEAQGPYDDPYVQGKFEENKKQIRNTLQQIKALKITIPRRIMTFFGLTVSGFSIV
jgi:RNA binding exosome subunit